MGKRSTTLTTACISVTTPRISLVVLCNVVPLKRGCSLLLASASVLSLLYHSPSPRYYSPSFGQSASIFRFTSGDISITSGHSRVKPSAESFFVQSKPILEP